MGMIDTEKIRNAAGVLDTLTSKLDHNHRLRVEAEHIAKSSVSFLYEIADTIDAQTAEITEAKGQIEHLDRQNNALREVLKLLAEIDLTKALPNDFAWFVLRARAALQEKSHD